MVEDNRLTGFTVGKTSVEHSLANEKFVGNIHNTVAAILLDDKTAIID